MCQQFSRLLIKIKKVGAKDVRQFNDDNAHVKVTQLNIIFSKYFKD